MQTSKPALELLTSDAIYRENPTALFHQLCGARPATLLLESADIDSKDDLKSLLLVDSALRITALGDTVTIQALSANGAALLELLDGALPSGIANQRQPNGRILTFPAVSSLLDEDARLCSLSVFDAFRLLQELVSVPDNEREAMFFGGLFAYDLVAGFEDLPQLQSDTACPDYCFYLAETLLVIDHQTKHTRIQASLFTPLENEKQRLEQRLSQLRQERQRAMTAGQHQLAVQCALTLQETFPAQAGDAWQLLTLLTHCWPTGMAAPAVAQLVDRLERRLDHSAAFQGQHAEAYRETLRRIRSHLAPRLPPLPAQ